MRKIFIVGILALLSRPAFALHCSGTSHLLNDVSWRMHRGLSRAKWSLPHDVFGYKGSKKCRRSGGGFP